MIDSSLVEPRAVVEVKAATDGGWFLTLQCSHTVWYTKVAKRLPCGICAQQCIRQIQAVCAQQAPRSYKRTKTA